MDVTVGRWIRILAILGALVLALTTAAGVSLPPAAGKGAPAPAGSAAAASGLSRPEHAPPPDPVGSDTRTALDLALMTRWESFTMKDGLPSDHVFTIRIDGDRIWAGTTNGLALYENGRWRSFGTADGLPHRVVLSVDVSPRTGDVWIGTMGGLARYSAGRFDVFTQINSGLTNNFINNVRCDPDEDTLWVATAMGVSRYHLRTGEWTTFNQENAPFHEPWMYGVTMGNGNVYVGAWGAGILELNKSTGVWREYRDPDKEFDLDLYADDGPVSDVTSTVDFGAGMLWQGSYVGLTRYDGREWRSYYKEDSGLAGNFVNFLRSQGRFAWIATDQGLSFTDGDGWATYNRRKDGRGEVRFFQGGKPLETRSIGTAIADDFTLGVDARGDDVWVATGRGVGHGIRGGAPGPGLRFPVEEETAGHDKPIRPERFRYAGTPAPLLPFGKVTPYKDLFVERSQFRGPGREIPEPKGLSMVSIGFIGPLEDQDNPVLPPGFRSAIKYSPDAVYGRRMLRAATLAVQEANAAGGYKGIPFQIVPRTDLVLWGQTSNELVRFDQDDHVWAVLSAFNSNHNHVMSRVTLKVEIPILSAGSTDPTLVEHNIPWLVRAVPDDRQQAYALLREVYFVKGLKRTALLRASDRDGRTGVDKWVSGSRRLGHPVILEKRFDPGDTDFKEQLDAIRETAPEALVLWGNAKETGLIVRQVRAMGMTLPIFGFDRMAGADFLETAGKDAEGVVAVSTMNPDSGDPAWRAFRERYQSRYGEDPDSFAAHAYDGMNLLIAAIREAGLNRALIRDSLYALKSTRGVSGEIVFDTNMSDVAPVWMATVQGGRYRYAPAPSWDEPRAAASSVRSSVP
jgi:branched-chain amino acid transport system substrate-binding protein